MNSNDENVQARLKELESELNQEQTASKESVKTVYAEIDTDSQAESELVAKVYSWLSTAGSRFKGLSAGGKLVVGVTALWFGVTALNFALHLISSLVSVAILGVILYFAYQKLIVERQS